MQRTFEQRFTIGYMDVDFRERLRPARAFEMLESVADVHAEQLGVTNKDPVMQGYAWVVARNHFQLFTMPKLGQELTIQTWPGRCQRAIYPRMFSIQDKTGRCIGGVHSLWMLLDIKRQRMASNPQLNALFPNTSDLKAPVSAPKKLTAPVPTRTPRYYTPAYSDLDTNRHVNNTKYIGWICDCFDPAQFENKSILDLEINYIQQVFAGERVRMDIQQQDDSFLIQGVNDNTGTVLFRAAGQFGKCE